MAEKIKVLSSDYEKYCADAEAMRYKCTKWPELEDIRDKIMTNLKIMLPFIAWILYTAPEPVNKREEDVKYFLDSITKEYYEYVEKEEELDEIPVSEKIIEMSFDSYVEECEKAEEIGPVAEGWPTLEELKRDGVRNLKKNLKKYIRLTEMTPCNTPEEKECCKYLNRLITANIRFYEEEEES